MDDPFSAFYGKDFAARERMAYMGEHLDCEIERTRQQELNAPDISALVKFFELLRFFDETEEVKRMRAQTFSAIRDLAHSKASYFKAAADSVSTQTSCLLEDRA